MGIAGWFICGAIILMFTKESRRAAEQREREEAKRKKEAAVRRKEALERKKEELYEVFSKIGNSVEERKYIRAANIAAREAREEERESVRENAVDSRRRDMPCFFNDGITANGFEKVAQHAASRFRRIKSVAVNGAVIYCSVESVSGYSDWDFSVDFNDWGHVTGKYWLITYNSDSSIPYRFARMFSGWVEDYYKERGIVVKEFSDYVDSNMELETSVGMNCRYKEKSFSRLFARSGSISISYGNHDLLGEHLYPVISLLKHSGFKNIKTFPVRDINDHTDGYCYQVEQVRISGYASFEQGMCFPANAEVQITYHEKQTITIPFSTGKLKRENFIAVRERLEELGFTHISERKIEDIVIGWRVKEGAVDQICVLGANDEEPISKNVAYDYDQELVIYYHTKKSQGAKKVPNE